MQAEETMMLEVEEPAFPTITLPGGYAPEEGAEVGDEVQALVTLRLEPDGQASIIAVDGAEYTGEPAVSEEAETMEGAELGSDRDYDFSTALSNAMTQMPT